MPLWIFTLGKRIFDEGNLVVPYSRIAALAGGLVIPLGLGFIVQKKFPKISRLLIRIMKPFSVILILFIVIFAIVTNLYLFKLFSWQVCLIYRRFDSILSDLIDYLTNQQLYLQIILAGMGLAWLGYICGWIAMVIFRQPNVDVRAIAIETGIQNTGIAIFLLRLGLSQPAADLTTGKFYSCTHNEDICKFMLNFSFVSSRNFFETICRDVFFCFQ